MIRELNASEFLSMLALAESSAGNNYIYRKSMNDLLDIVYAIEDSCPDIRINFSRNSIESFQMQVKTIIIRGEDLIIDVNKNYSMLRWCEPEVEIRDMCLSIIKG